MIPLLRECVKRGGGMRVRVGERRFNHSEQPEQVVLVIAVRGDPGRARAILGERASRPLILKTNLSLLRGRDARSPKVPVSTVHCKSSQPTTVLSLDAGGLKHNRRGVLAGLTILGERASRPLLLKTNLSLLRGRDARSPKVPVSTVHCKSSQPTIILSLGASRGITQQARSFGELDNPGRAG